MAKSNLILNKEWGVFFRALSDDQAGMLIKALYACHEGEKISVDPVISAAFAMMSIVVRENAERYEARCRQNAENRSKARSFTIVDDGQGSEGNKKKKKEENKKKNMPAGKFGNFPQRDDPEYKDLVQQVIRSQ